MSHTIPTIKGVQDPYTTLGLFTKPNARYSKERVSFLSSMLCRQLPIYVYLVILLRILKGNTENGLLFTCSFYVKMG